MSKFGDIISSKVPVLIDFYSHNLDPEMEKKNLSLLKDVATGVSGTARVVKIDIAQNQALANMLRVKASPTFFIYKNNEMLWRQNGAKDAKSLIDIIESFI